MIEYKLFHQGKVVKTFESHYAAVVYAETHGLLGYHIQQVPVITFSLN